MGDRQEGAAVHQRYDWVANLDISAKEKDKLRKGIKLMRDDIRVKVGELVKGDEWKARRVKRALKVCMADALIREVSLAPFTNEIQALGEVPVLRERGSGAPVMTRRERAIIRENKRLMKENLELRMSIE